MPLLHAFFITRTLHGIIRVDGSIYQCFPEAAFVVEVFATHVTKLGC